MLVGAVASFTAASVTGSIYLGFLLETPASLGQRFRSTY